MRFIILILALASLHFNTAAQTTNKNADLQKSIKDISALFKKKKKDSTVTIQTGGTATTGNTGSNTPLPSSASSKNHLVGGTLAPNAKSIDADQLSNFNGGAAIIRKGTAAAMIDSAGNTLVPFNKYDMSNVAVSFNRYAMLMNGMFKSNINLSEWGFVNAKGKVIVSGVLNNLTENKRLIELQSSGSFIYTTADGKKYTLKEQLTDINEGIGITRVTTDNGNRVLWGYKKLSGETVTATVFDEAYHFYDGMACVGKKNEFGEMKYGFINTQGKLVIPFSFSVKPGDFTSGLAKVQPKDRSQFEYAFINKAGELVFKQTQADVAKYGSFDHFTNYGLAFTFKYILDTSFKMITVKDFFISLGLPADSWFIQPENFMEGETNPKLLFSSRGVISPYTQMPIIGFINLSTKKVVMPIFDYHDSQIIYFDPVSHLAYAKVVLGKNNTGGLVYREGYINEDGLFVMVKGQAATW